MQKKCLSPRHPETNDPDLILKIQGRRGEALAVVVILLATVAGAQEPTRFHPGFNLFSKEQDIQLGQESAAQVRKRMHVIKDPLLSAYVNQVGKRLATSQEAQENGFPFTFEVVADPTINAFALPGGPMFINTGLLKAGLRPRATRPLLRETQRTRIFGPAVLVRPPQPR